MRAAPVASCKYGRGVQPIYNSVLGPAFELKLVFESCVESSCETVCCLLRIYHVNSDYKLCFRGISPWASILRSSSAIREAERRLEAEDLNVLLANARTAVEAVAASTSGDEQRHRDVRARRQPQTAGLPRRAPLALADKAFNGAPWRVMLSRHALVGGVH